MFYNMINFNDCLHNFYLFTTVSFIGLTPCKFTLQKIHHENSTEKPYNDRYLQI